MNMYYEFCIWVWADTPCAKYFDPSSLTYTDENISVNTPTEIIWDTEDLQQPRSEPEKPAVAS